MSALAEFASFEFAGAEFSIDPKRYADIVGTATLALAAAGSVGVAISMVGAAQVGAVAAPAYTAVMATVATALARLTAEGRVGEIQGMSPGASLRLNGDAASGYAVTASGTATFAFTGTAEPHSGDTDAAGAWSWAGEATGATLQKFDGSGVFGFMADPRLSATFSTVPVASLTLTGAGRATALQSITACAGWIVSATAVMAAQAALAPLATLAATGAAKVAGVLGLQGAAQLTLAASAVGAWRRFADAAATSAVTVAGQAEGAALADTRAAAPWVFQGAASVASVREFSASDHWRLTGAAAPGATVFSSLPASRARFTVPPRAAAFTVPPEPEFEDV